jgi:transcriptional regulator ATRX
MSQLNLNRGKSLQVITLVHTVLTNPVLTSNLNARLNRILLVVPVNTLANWCNEFSKWTVDVPKIRLFDFNSSGNQSGRRNVARRWQKDGGILIISFDTLSSVSKDGFFTDLLLSKLDVVILDEAHLMLKNSSSLISKALSKVVTSRKIALTGTPLQNNLMEYFRIINWVRPGCIGSEQEFEKKYMKILDESLRSDATVDVQLEGEKLVLDLTESTSSFVHRLDSSVLENDLPPIKQVVLHVRRTRVQSMLHQAFKKYRARGNNNNFLLNFAKLFPVNNHPGVLLKTFQKEIKPSESDKKEVFTARENPKIEQRVHVTKDTGQESQTSCEVIVIDDTDSEEEDVVQAAISNQPEEDGDISMENEEDKDVEWWADVAKKFEFNRIEHGGKVVLLLQLLAHAEMIGK